VSVVCFAAALLCYIGLGAPGNLIESYDPKLATFAMVFASSFYYNAMGQISQTNVNMLHTAAIVSKVFEKGTLLVLLSC